MSGPIVRKYGFPNFDKIFGEHKLEHGVEDRKDSVPGADKTATESAAEIPQEGAGSQGRKKS